MGSCAGSLQGSWTPASGPLGPQHLYEPASWCGCGWGPPAYPCSPHPGVYWDPPVCPRSATWICGCTPSAQEATSNCEKAHSDRGQNPGLARAMGGWIPLVFVLGLVGAQIHPTPQSLAPSQPRFL